MLKEKRLVATFSLPVRLVERARVACEETGVAISSLVAKGLVEQVEKVERWALAEKDNVEIRK